MTAACLGLSGQWELCRTEGVVEFMKAIGKSDEYAEAATKIQVTMEIKESDANIIVATVSPGGAQYEMCCVKGEETEVKLPSGDQGKVLIKFEEDKMVEYINKIKENKQVKLTKQVVGEELVNVMEMDNHSCQHIFKRVQA